MKRINAGIIVSVAIFCCNCSHMPTGSYPRLISPGPSTSSFALPASDFASSPSDWMIGSGSNCQCYAVLTLYWMKTGEKTAETIPVVRRKNRTDDSAIHARFPWSPEQTYVASALLPAESLRKYRREKYYGPFDLRHYSFKATRQFSTVSTILSLKLDVNLNDRDMKPMEVVASVPLTVNREEHWALSPDVNLHVTYVAVENESLPNKVSEPNVAPAPQVQH